MMMVIIIIYIQLRDEEDRWFLTAVILKDSALFCVSAQTIY